MNQFRPLRKMQVRFNRCSFNFMTNLRLFYPNWELK